MISLAHFDAQARTILVEARRRAMLKRRRAIGSHEILSALADTNEIADLLAHVGIRLESVVEQLGDTPPSAELLLRELGIDLPAVQSALPTARLPRSCHWRMRRSIVRPLRVTLESPSTSIPFDGSGRKVLEVAVWASKRHERLANSLDLLRGVLSDGADPAVYALTASGSSPFKQLLHELARSEFESV